MDASFQDRESDGDGSRESLYSLSGSEESSQSESDATDGGGPIRPYSHEPVVDGSSSSDLDESGTSSDSDDGVERLTSLSWCSCGHCSAMAAVRECMCCTEIPAVVEKLHDSNSTLCITQHPGFDAVCFNVWVLQTAYFEYRQNYGTPSATTVHERYRYIAYRQLTRWCSGWLGRDIRVILPACAVTRIRESFPSDTYTGFYPTMF